MSKTIVRLAAALATTACLAAAPAAHAMNVPQHAAALAPTASDQDCPDDTFCVHDAHGHFAHFRVGSNDVRIQHLEGGATWSWNRTQATWCIYNLPNRGGQNAKVRPGGQGGSGFTFFSLKPAWHGFCV
ncbi:peptidase inhibitor family I36 protein [Streptomyces sp. NPDC020192]|uniref:peptidase inhibitor family I36 protein n=1 Tax=Streptomyces sp. NPDC020192 TaxID=3365066 RepID=UPI0037948A55